MSLLDYLQYDFVINLIVVVVLVALCASLLGVVLVLKRYSVIGDGLSHVAFGAFAIASILNVSNNMYVVLPITIVCAILLLAPSKKKYAKGDALIAVISVGCLAVGYLLMNVFPSSNTISGDVCTSLFGSTAILTLSLSDVIISVILSVLVILYFIFFYNKIFLTTFDEDFANSTGTKVNFYNLALAVVIAIIVVLGMKLVGSLLISALIVFPALASMRIFKSFKSVVISSAIFAVVCSLAGIIIALSLETPVGATIVCMDIIGYLIYIVISLFK